jgi:hypothetical protein
VKLDPAIRQSLYQSIEEETTRNYLDQAAQAVIRTNEKCGNVVVVVGSGPNLHEGVTTLIAALIQKGLIDGVITSSAVINHEMSGSLDRVHRVRVEDLPDLGMPHARDAYLEATHLSPETLTALQEEMLIDMAYYHQLMEAPGNDIIKAAGNMAYPMGLRTEQLAREVQSLAVGLGLPFETVAGWGADPHTMLGAATRRGIPLLVGVPQLVGGGAVGLAVGDSIPITERSSRIARMLAGADVIIESAVALTQEIHDGPFETYTGHGVWSHWQGHWTFSLKDKTLVRIDLDPNLVRAWQFERQSGTVSQAIAEGLPKTKLMDVPFRMEMSGFARLPGSLPVLGDIGVIWPLLAAAVCEALDCDLDFYSYPQSTEAGQEMRAWIVDQVHPVDRARMLEKARQYQEEV